MTSETDIPAYDTQDLIKRLTDADMPEAQAIVLAQEQALLHKIVHQKIIEGTEIPAFDTQSLIKRLTDAGMPEAQAIVVAQQQALVHKIVYQRKLEDAGIFSEA